MHRTVYSIIERAAAGSPFLLIFFLKNIEMIGVQLEM